jgi:hypothetical protein
MGLQNTNACDVMRCFFFGLVRLVLCKIFARWVYKNANAHDDTMMRCCFFGLVRLVLCKIFARWVYKNTNAHDDTTLRSFVSDLCVWFFVKYLQDGFTKIQAHAMTR